MKASALTTPPCESSLPFDPNSGETRERVARRPCAIPAAPGAPEDFPALDASATAISLDTARMLETLLGNLDGMVYRCRSDEHWTMEFVSEGCERLTGYRPRDLLMNDRISYELLTHEDDRARVREEVQAGLARQRRFDLEYRIVRADGRIVWVWERGVGIYDAKGALIAIEGIVQDISERKEAERRYRDLFEHAVEGIFRTTPDGRFLDANPALARIYGFDSPQALMAELRDIRGQLYVDPSRREEFMRLIKVRGSISGFESQIYRRDGQVIWVEENARAVTDEAGRLVCYEGTVQDITERKAYEARIERAANYDALTGLANRVLLDDRLEQAILSAASYGTRLAVVFVDLDHFKQINDTLGHEAGDELLRAMAQRLKASVRETDTVARLGGDEFVLLINNQGDPPAIAVLLERMLADICRPWRIGQAEFKITCSLGVALYPDDGVTAETLLRHADSAMYRAKGKGRNNFQFFTPEINSLISERQELESRLRQAFAQGRFSLCYQPRVDMATRRIVGAEALIRWPDEPRVAPARFVAVAEEIGLSVPLGRWVLERACAQARSWDAAGLPPVIVSVNVSERQFRQDDFVESVAEVLAASGLDPARLEIELTESAVTHDVERFMVLLGKLARLGVRLTLDDFGTGCTNLSALKRLPLHRLKMDGSFVRGIGTDMDDSAIVRSIVALGHNLGLKVVAEGVESEGQVAFLRASGCDELQGYYFGVPMSGESFAARLRGA